MSILGRSEGEPSDGHIGHLTAPAKVGGHID